MQGNPTEQKVKAPSDIDLLQKAKEYSDRGDYAAKTHILRKMIQEKPGDWVVDSEKLDTVGLTHTPTGFKVHMKKDAYPSAVPQKTAASMLSAPLNKAREATNKNPTPSQVETGNYKKGDLSINGIKIKLEYPKGSTRRGYKDGKEIWSRVMKADYGYFKGTEAADGDAVDCYIGPDHDSELVVAIDQYKGDKFDEVKFVLCVKSREQGEKIYMQHYPSDWKLGPVSTTTLHQMKVWLKDGDHKKPFKGQMVKTAADAFVPNIPDEEMEVENAPDNETAGDFLIFNPSKGFIGYKTAEVTLDIEEGDILLGGRYKNKPHVVEELGTDELGQPTINGMKLLAFRIKKKMPSKETAPAAEKTASMYHGSPEEIHGNRMEPRPSRVLDEESAVFGTPDREMALSFARKWRDDDFEHGTVNGQKYMRENRPGAFEELMKGPGRIHRMPGEGFEEDPRLTRSERINRNAVDIEESEDIPDVLEALQNSGFLLLKHGEKAPWERDAADMVNKTAASLSNTTTIGRLMFDDIVPEKHRENLPTGSEIGSVPVADILRSVANRDPDLYRDISYKLMRLGVKGSVETNTSFTLDDLEYPGNKPKMLERVQLEVSRIRDDKKLSPAEKKQKILDLYDKTGRELPSTIFDEALKRGSNLAKMVASGARGNKGQLNSNIGADFAVFDSRGKQLPLPISRSYAEGLTPAQYFAASYGTRLGVVATKFSVEDGGFFSKQLTAAAADLVVTETDCGTSNGYPTLPDDKNNIGSVLARDVGQVRAGTVITPRILHLLKSESKNKNIVVRSPIACRAKNAGLCSMCSGVRERGRLPQVGENVGINAAAGLSEPVTQSLLSTKHSAGTASSGGASKVRGFPQINAIAQIPDAYPGAAALSKADGKVSRIEDAPQGGQFIFVGEEKYYTPPDRPATVKPGDIVEAGDALSDGTPNPSQVVASKGLGSGRDYFINAFRKALTENGSNASRRNVEVMARAIVNHVRISGDDISGKFLPGDIVEYPEFEKTYVPEPDTKPYKPSQAVGMYLQKPVLHYTLGTRITPSIAKVMEDTGEEQVEASAAEPMFHPNMVRMMDNPAYKPDFMTHTGHSYVKRNVTDDIKSGGGVSMAHGKYFGPPLAKGVDFGNTTPDNPGY